MTSKKREKYARCSLCSELVMLSSGKFSLHKDSVSGDVCASSLFKPRPEDERVIREVVQAPRRDLRRASSRVAPNRKGHRDRYVAVCRSCKEEHRLTAEGLMSIHHDSRGQRCKGSSSAEDIMESKRRRPSDPPTKQANDRPGNHPARAKDGSPRNKLSKEERKLKNQVKKAVADAMGNKKHKSKSRPKAKGVDKAIYAVNGVRTVSGGSPSLGKRR